MAPAAPLLRWPYHQPRRPRRSSLPDRRSPKAKRSLRPFGNGALLRGWPALLGTIRPPRKAPRVVGRRGARCARRLRVVTCHAARIHIFRYGRTFDGDEDDDEGKTPSIVVAPLRPVRIETIPQHRERYVRANPAQIQESSEWVALGSSRLLTFAPADDGDDDDGDDGEDGDDNVRINLQPSSFSTVPLFFHTNFLCVMHGTMLRVAGRRRRRR